MPHQDELSSGEHNQGIDSLLLHSVWHNRLSQEVKSLKKSWRWKIGHGLVSFLELVLGKQHGPLAIDNMEFVLRAQERYLNVLKNPEVSKTIVSDSAKIICKQILNERIHSHNLTIAFAVSDAQRDSKSGDFFTAMELARACQSEYGWHIRFLDLRKKEYDLTGVDILVVLIDGYDLSKIQNANEQLVTIAWPRNWFDKWAEQLCLQQSDIILTSAIYCIEYFRILHRKESHFFPIATSSHNGVYTPKYASDYCFTGSYWGSRRKIAEWLKPRSLDYDFALFGKGWNWPKPLWRWNRGFVPYREMPHVYASTKLVIDDANETTELWGSVNSRVFDALGAGKLVITNGEKGARELFGDKLPVYRNAEELHELIRYYLTHNDKRESLAFELQKIVLAEHTYAHRARTLKDIILNYLA